jgi:hypothetical protein
VSTSNVILGVDTIGSYIANIIAGSNVTLSGNMGSEGAIVTITAAGGGGGGSSDWSAITNKPDPQINVILTGDVTGSGNAILTDITNNTITITTVIQPDSVTLGTDTFGPYVANLLSGNGIVLTNLTGESAVPNITLAPTGVTEGSYGNSTAVSSVTVDAWGRLTTVSTTPINFDWANVTNKTQYVGTILTGNGIVISDSGGVDSTPNITLSPTGVTATTYGSSNVVPVFSVDEWGRITSASNVNIPGVTSTGADWNSVVNKPRPQINVILTGDVTGSANAILESVTSNTITITTTIQPDSVILGTDTTGAYLANILPGTGVTIINNTGGETAIPTISIGQDVSDIANVTFKNLVVTGNLQVLGNTITFEANNLVINDGLIQLGKQNNTDSIDLGFVAHYNDGVDRHAGLFRDATDKNFKLFFNYPLEPSGTTIDTSNVDFEYANLFVDNLYGNVSWSNVTNKTHYVGSILSGNGIVVTNTNVPNSTPNITLSPSGVIASTYGNTSIVPIITVDTWGRITNIANSSPIQTPNNLRLRNINFIIDGGGVPILAGNKGVVTVPANSTINSWVITSEANGNIVIDILRCTYAAFPNASSIAGTSKPTLVYASKNTNTTMTGWGNVYLNSQDMLIFNVQSGNTVTRTSISLNLVVTD